MSKNKDMIRTSVQIPETLFEDFKMDCIKSKFSIQKLTERSMYLYMTSPEFKKEIHNVLDTFFTGSYNK
jgi:uncharacterized membrane protein YheB (UPF0754 family)